MEHITSGAYLEVLNRTHVSDNKDIFLLKNRHIVRDIQKLNLLSGWERSFKVNPCTYRMRKMIYIKENIVGSFEIVRVLFKLRHELRRYYRQAYSQALSAYGAELTQIIYRLAGRNLKHLAVFARGGLKLDG